MRLIVVTLLLAISYAQTVTVGDCESNLTPETCTGNGDDGFPCRWHAGDNGCKEDTGGGGFPTVTGTTTGTTGGETPPTGTGTTTGTSGSVVLENDGCEEFPETSCTTQTGENGETCHWVIGQGCKKADCEHFLDAETCAGQTGEHGRACVYLPDEGCEETPGVDGSDGIDALEHEGCESYTVDTCSANSGENGVACHWYENECKESNCEHYITEADCQRATDEDGETCAWNLGDGCKEASDPTEPHCDYYDETTCASSTGENGKQCYWDPTENNGLGKCDEDNASEISDLPEFENPGTLRSIHMHKTSAPSAMDYAAVFFITFFMTAGVTFAVLRNCSKTPSEDIDLSYRAVV